MVMRREQYRYATFLRATLSRYELVMLYYNGLFHPKMKRLMERYHLLNNLRPDLLSLTRENYVYLQSSLGSNKRQEAIKQGFSASDYEMYLTGSDDDPSKYYLGAFYTESEMPTSKELLNHWHQFVKM